MAEPAPARVTLRHLADRLNLSPTTVSRALNGYPEVGRQTRERVREAARRLGYAPDASARRLAHGRADAFGVVVPSGEYRQLNPIFAEFLGGILDYAAEAGVEVSLIPVAPHAEIEAYRRAATERSVDGIIVTSPRAGGDPRIEALLETNTPFVLHGRTDGTAPFAWLDIDNYGAFQRVGEHLLAHGHRRLALLGGDTAQTFGRHRRTGLRASLTAYGLEAQRLQVCDGPMTAEMGEALGRELLDVPAGQAPTAVVCSSIFVALGLARAAHRLGRRIPADLSIVAHDDRASYLQADQFDPPLTATQSSLRLAGQAVAGMLEQRISGIPVTELQREWPVELVQRHSVAQPPASS